ncbi:unnamed protein product [Closterium sp. NIES-53]
MFDTFLSPPPLPPPLLSSHSPPPLTSPLLYFPASPLSTSPLTVLFSLPSPLSAVDASGIAAVGVGFESAAGRQ